MGLGPGTIPQVVAVQRRPPYEMKKRRGVKNCGKRCCIEQYLQKEKIKELFRESEIKNANLTSTAKI